MTLLGYPANELILYGVSRAISSFILLISFLFSQVGLTSAKHYCGDFLATSNVGLLAKATNCGMEMGKASCGNEDESASEKSCCHDEIEHLKADTESLKIVNSELHFPDVVFIHATALFHYFSAILYPEQAESVMAISHSPPYILSSLRLLAFLQVFLI
ncbi:MAG: hypothetical protein EOO04_17150 [Chitinophagaceae bacterium]|nr:MAG: hypothetical protein EOO04_17150 [Chitinophagaceae bacterium]